MIRCKARCDIFYLNDSSRNSDTKIASRGVVMTAASTCKRSGKQGHYARNCWKRKDDNDDKSTGSHDKQKNKESSRGKAASNVGAKHKRVLYTRLPPTMTRNATAKERHAHRRVEALTLPLLYKAQAHASPTTTRSRPSTSMTMSTRDSPLQGCLSNTQKTRVYALTACFFDSWTARLIHHQPLL